jgi:hypothetical protein
MDADNVYPLHDRYGHGGCRPFDPVMRWDITQNEPYEGFM